MVRSQCLLWEAAFIRERVPHLLQSCLVCINTLMLQRVLAEPAWMARMTPADRRGLTPLVWGHVSPYGAFDLDMARRLDLDLREAA